MSTLRPEHTPYIFSYWKYKDNEDPQKFKEKLQKFPSSAIYKEDDTEETHPLAWGIVYDCGTFGMIHTLPEFRRRGFGKAIVANLAEKMAQLGIPINADTDPENKNMKDLLKKVGFEQSQYIYSCFYQPKRS